MRRSQRLTPGGAPGSEPSPAARHRSPGGAARLWYTSDPTHEEGSQVFATMKRVPYPAFAVAVLCGVAACVSGPGKSDAQLQTDKETAERVEAALNADKALFAKHITAHADNGVVRLTGYVWQASDFEEAVFVAGAVPGVTRVVNDMELNRNGNDNGPVAR